MLSIILAIENEDDRCFVESLYLQYHKKIFYTALEVVRREADAEDCVQDMVRLIIDNLELFRMAKGDHLIALLSKCTRNLAIDRYRREKKRMQQETDYYVPDEEQEIEMEFPSREELPVDILINEENRRRLTELIGELPPIYQNVLYFRYQMNLSGSETAKLLRVSESVVKTRLHRARKILLETRSRELYALRENG